jgi:cellobiose phosphorylase
VPGVRENGGQYTHAAVWTVMAFFADGRTERAWQLFNLINPLRHAEHEAGMETYMVEPYVIAADVLAVPPHTGRGGWTWYTGSAGWMYRLISESMLGLRRRGSRLLVEPKLPDSWNALDIEYRFGEALYRIHISRAVENSIACDGLVQADMSIELSAEKQTHDVEVHIAR